MHVPRGQRQWRHAEPLRNDGSHGYKQFIDSTQSKLFSGKYFPQFDGNSAMSKKMYVATLCANKKMQCTVGMMFIPTCFT